MRIFQTYSPHLSDVATLPWQIQKSFLTALFMHTCDYLLYLRKKTHCNTRFHPTRKCHHTTLSNAKFSHLTEGLLRSFKCWWL